MTETSRAAALSAADLARYIDHTALKAETSAEDIARVVAEARRAGVKSVCVNPRWVSTVKQGLEGSEVLTCTVIGFPLGASATAVKAFETTQAIAEGADEVDMVIDVAAARAGDRERLVEDIRAVAEAAHADGAAGEGGALLKVIVETALLDNDAIVLACEAAVEAGADYVKTSTGFSTAGATEEHVALMRATVGEGVGVKASGGVRTREDAVAMIEAGASRIGASATLAILGLD
ncbi:MAG: deoxyribose-phosphate aldolase [Micrococcus sp.]|nr:deoxyribose-phosphate aldolase [Micrococcus sp.]